MPLDPDEWTVATPADSLRTRVRAYLADHDETAYTASEVAQALSASRGATVLGVFWTPEAVTSQSEPIDDRCAVALDALADRGEVAVRTVERGGATVRYYRHAGTD
ncbi:hypothetical protein ACFQPA_11925 [Halomarina halobia]|uniref:MarR family transcriptional regulator n=1 Tax=Halomarina halobia TaxID=3033386 RepID=A0ABD6A9G6_9EURY|nr:hypothetical protein [Halomarina sp. PSR21]